jgi:hypothetical protein
MAHPNNIRIVAGHNFAEIAQSIEQILAKQEGNCCSQHHQQQPCGRRFFRPGCKKD